MIGLDTNVLVRYITQDDAKQSAQATRLMESLTVEVPGYVTVVSVLELVWVLTGCYASSRSEVSLILENLLRTKELRVACADMVWKAVRLYRAAKGDFADCLIMMLAKEEGCEAVLTFDREAVKFCGMKLVA